MDSSTFNSTQDIRSATRDYKRDADNRHKWENGEQITVGRSGSHGRPSKNKFAVRREPKGTKQAANHQAKTIMKRNAVIDTNETTDSSADEDVDAPSTANEPDADIAYSFDSYRGPNQGSQVLGYALEQAVERYENHTTEKLVKDEYLVLDTEGEAIQGKKGKKAAFQPALLLDEDEDYELI